jgi:hypothetical protein
VTAAIPGYWMNETGGVLRPAIESYLAGGDLAPHQVAVIRVYLWQWMGGDWRGPMVDVLRTAVYEITTRADIDGWLDRALNAGIDPL